MALPGWLYFLAWAVLVAATVPFLGNYMAKVYGNKKAPGDRFFLPIENAFYRVCGIGPDNEQRWNMYALSLLMFSFISALLTYAGLRLQGHLPFNPDHVSAVSPGQSFQTAISFLTNTNWQAYTGESTMSHLSQMFALTTQQFWSAAVGMAVAVALIRAIIRKRQRTLGNFWVDMTRTITRILLPLSFVFALVFMSQGVIQSFHAEKAAKTVAVQAVDGQGAATQVQKIPGGPVASMVPIEALGDNGGGYFNGNAAHPYENPNGITMVLLYWLVAIIPFAFPWTFGRMVGSMRQGMVILLSMIALFVIPLVILAPFEGRGNPKLNQAGVSQAASQTNPGGNLEGKDLRLGVSGSTLSASAVTATSAGATASAHESYTPVGGAIPLFNILLGEVSPGGTGSGLFGKLILVFTGVFIAGLMVGRTPEYLGKKIAAVDVKLVVLYVLVVPIVTLVFAACTIVMGSALRSVSTAGPAGVHSGPHGLTEVVYAYSEGANANGSAFAGFNSNTDWNNTAMGFVMLAGRFWTIIPVLALGGSLVRKQPSRITAGSFRTDTPIFLGLLIAVTMILVGLTYFPVMALGPIVEHLSGKF